MSRPSLTVSVAEVAALVRERVWVVVGIAAAVLGCVLIDGYGSELVFAARAQLFLGEVFDAASEAAAGEDGDGVSGEIEILGSASVLERAILASGLNANVGTFERGAPRYSEWLAAGRDVGALPRAENELVVSEARLEGAQPVQYGVELVAPARYRVWCGAQLLGEGELGAPFAAGGLSWTLLPGPSRAPRPGVRYEVTVTPAGSKVLEVSERLQIAAPRAKGSPHYGRIVTLEFTAGSPYQAERFLASLLDAYLAHRHERKIAKLLAREAYLESESRSVERALQGVEAELAEVRSSQRTLWPGDEESPLLVERERYQNAESRALLEVARLNVYADGFSGPAPPLASFMDSEAGDRQLDELSAALADAERELTEARQLFMEDAPEVQEQTARVAERKRAIGRYVEARLARARERHELLERLVRQNESKLGLVERLRAELAELRRDQDAYAETYTRLMKQKEDAALGIARAVSKDRIIDPPRAVLEPASPNLREALSSGLFGLFVGALAVLFRRLTAGTLQAPSDARFFLGDVPIHGTIPCHERRPGRRRVLLSDVLEQARLSGHTEYEEAFRLFGLSWLGPLSEPEQQVVLVTSPEAGDGKTSAVLALGLALSRRGRRVLIVDGTPARHSDLARASAPPAPGLEDVLAGRVHLRGARVAVSAGPGELHVLGAGAVGLDQPPASADQLEGFLQLARARYDVVLLDVPGQLPSSAMALAGLCDRVLLIVRLRHTRRRALAELLGRLPRARSVALVVDDRRRSAPRRARRWAVVGEERPVAS